MIGNLEDYISDTATYTTRGRLGEILCLIPVLKSISSEMIEIIQFTKLFGFAEVDALIQEMLLNREDNDAMSVFNGLGNSGLQQQELQQMPQQPVNYADANRGKT